jgi:hypothetical protein
MQECGDNPAETSHLGSDVSLFSENSSSDADDLAQEDFDDARRVPANDSHGLFELESGADCVRGALSAAGESDVYGWVGELIDAVPGLQAANAQWMNEVVYLRNLLEETKVEHALELAQCKDQAASEIASIMAAFDEERQDRKRIHQMELSELEAEKEEEKARRLCLEKEVELLKTKHAKLTASSDSRAQQLVQSLAELRNAQNDLRNSRLEIGELQKGSESTQQQHLKAIREKEEARGRLGVEIVALKTHLRAAKEQQQRSAQLVAAALKTRDPDLLWASRPPLLDKHQHSVPSMTPGAHALWNAWWSCTASGKSTAESFEWHMAQVSLSLSLISHLSLLLVDADLLHL